MSGEIASAFVRVRPDMSGFGSEVQSGVKQAFSGVSRTIGGALAAAGAFDFAKSILSSAAKDQAAFAVLDRAVKNAHASVRLFGNTLEETLKKEAALKGFNDEELAAAFTRLISVTHNTTRAFADLQKAEDLSRARGLDIATAALAIGKAEQGRTTSLQRYGLIVPKVTAAEDALKRRRAEAVAAGAKFTAGENAIYQAALANAKVIDAQGSRTAALTLITKRFGGVATEYANTASGQFARLRENLHLLEETVGKVFIGGLGTAAASVGNFANSLAHNAQFVHAMQSTAHGLGVALHDVAVVARDVAPALETIATAVEHVAQSVGAGPILAAVAAYKGLSIAVGLAGAATTLYARAIQASLGPVAEATAANAGLAASEAAVAAAGTTASTGGIAAFARGLAVLGARGAGGPTGLAVAGLAVLAGAFTYLLTRTSEAQQKMQEFVRSLQPLGQSLAALPGDKLAADQARLNLEVANNAVATSKAKPGSIEWTQLHLAQRQAALSLTEALHQLGVTQGNVAAQTKAARDAISGSIEAQLKNYDSQIKSLGNFPPGSPGFAKQQKMEVQATALEVQKLVEKLDEQAKAEQAQAPLLAHNITLLREYVQAIGKVPTAKTIEFFLDNRNAKASLKDLTNSLTGKSSDLKQAAVAAGRSYAYSFWEGLSSGITAAAEAQRTGAWAGIGQAIEMAADAAARDAASGRAHRKIVSAAAAAIKSLRDALSLDAESLQEINQQIADQAVQGPEAIAQAIASAQQNFDQIGQTIAGDLAQVMQQPFVIAQERMNLEGDRAALSFDRQATKLQARATAINAQINRMSIAQQARDARFVGENARIQQEENRLSLRSDKNTLAQLRREIILPGGRTLSTDPKAALAELERYAAHAHGAARLAIQDYIDQFRRASLSVEKDKIGIATETKPGQATRQADLQLQATRLSLRQAIFDARRAAVQARQQLRADTLRIGADVAAIRARVAAREIADLTDAFNRAPTAANLKRVTAKIAQIMSRDHVSFEIAGERLGTAFMHGFQAQLTGLGRQGQASLGLGGGAAGAGGLIPAIVRPLETIRQQQETQARLAHQQRAVQIDIARKHSTLLQKIHSAQVAKSFIDSLGRNPGKQTSKTKHLAGTTG